LYKIPANTLFVGKNLVFVPECPSTNALALEISQQSAAKDGTVVITDSQTAGKGQRGNTWEAAPGLNLTFSIITKPGFLAVNKQFYLNIVISLALKDYLEEKIPDAVYVKWPNDILVHDRKISGILIENQLHGSTIVHSVIGIGINLNQQNFNSSTATSLSLVTGREYDRERELALLLPFIERRYLELRRGDYGRLMDAYLAALYRRNARHVFSSGGETFEGIIRDLDEWGKLRVETEQGVRVFDVKELYYIS